MKEFKTGDKVVFRWHGVLEKDLYGVIKDSKYRAKHTIVTKRKPYIGERVFIPWHGPIKQLETVEEYLGKEELLVELDDGKIHTFTVDGRYFPDLPIMLFHVEE